MPKTYLSGRDVKLLLKHNTLDDDSKIIDTFLANINRVDDVVACKFYLENVFDITNDENDTMSLTEFYQNIDVYKRTMGCYKSKFLYALENKTNCKKIRRASGFVITNLKLKN